MEELGLGLTQATSEVNTSSDTVLLCKGICIEDQTEAQI